MTDNDLAQLNDHFARFLQHADSLLGEWKSYGDKLRASIDQEVGALHDKMAVSVERAGKTAAANLDGQLEASLGEGLARLRGEVDRLTKLTAGAAAARAGARRETAKSPLMLGALILANVMLAALVVMTARSCTRDDTAATGAAVAPGPDAASALAAGPPVDAAPAIDAEPPPPPEFCALLVDDYELAAATSFVETASAVCGIDAEAVKDNLVYNLPKKAKKKPKAPPKKKGAK